MGAQAPLTLAEVARRLDRAGITWAVFAGAAATAYGVTRPITDVDILIPITDGGRVAALFPEAVVKRCEDGAVRSIQLPGFDLVAGLTTADLDAAMAARIVRYPLLGVTVPIIPAPGNRGCLRAGRLSGGFSMKQITSKRQEYLKKWVIEICRAELTHWIAMLPSLLFFLWNPLSAGLLIVLYAMVVNLPCVIVQRYNRPRLLRIIANTTPEVSNGRESSKR